MVKKRRVTRIIFWVLLVLGLAIRLIDITDPPLGFHPTRQLRNAIIARGIYYASDSNANPETQDLAIEFQNSMAAYEPPIIETISAAGYHLIGEENIIVPRMINGILWILGGYVLFVLANSMTSVQGALFSLGYYLFLPFGVQASRSFQPDPLMTVSVILFIYAIYKWEEERTWKWAILAGIFGGFSILVKIVAVYLVAGAAVFVMLYVVRIKKCWRNPQVWVIAVLMISPALFFYLLRDPAGAGNYFRNWTVALAHLTLTPDLYIRWMSFAGKLMSLVFIFLGVFGVLVSKPKNRILLFGLWVGYGVYGLTLPYQMYTHDYYHLQLIPVLALSLAPIIDILSERLAEQSKPWKAVFIGILLIGIIYPLWVARSVLASRDFHHEPAYWKTIGEIVPDDGRIVALTQDYGYRLMYYGWTKVSLWPPQSELNLAELRGRDVSENDFDDVFAKYTEGKRYFLVTSLSQLDRQPLLKDELLGNYPILNEVDGFVLFDLEP